MIVVSVIARNEADRYLEQTLICARTIVDELSGRIRVTDDASTDNTVDLCLQYGAEVQLSPEPLFWRHEGRARQRHYDFTTAGCREDDWVLALDADETINDVETLAEVWLAAQRQRAGHVLMPLYEFWTPQEYRVDGYWFGTQAMRFYRFQPGGQINDREMGCGSEPGYVAESKAYHQDKLHLLHWGYLRPEDRVRKHAAYSARLGGHGHNNGHVASIVTTPTLAGYFPG